FLTLHPPPRSTLFPYTTLFRSSRALRKGDFVSVNAVEGVVAEVGTLATKVVTMRNEEITIPNSVLIGNPIHNYSKLAGEQGTMRSEEHTSELQSRFDLVCRLLL